MSKKRIRKDIIDGYLFSLPALIIFALFMIYPLIYGFIISLNQWDGLGEKTFIGFENYTTLFQDQQFWQALSHNGIIAVVIVAGKVILGLLIALMLAGKFRGVTAYRTAYFMPMIMSTVAVGLLWSYIYNFNFGLVNNALRALGVPNSHLPTWLGDSSTALLSVMLVEIWRWVGYHTVIFIAALQGIPNDLYEAALVDGANNVQKHWYITIPQLKTSIVLNAILSLISALGTFDLVYVMTDGGPNRATETILTYMYKQAFVGDRFGYASAIAYIAFAIIIVFTVFQTRVMTEE